MNLKILKKIQKTVEHAKNSEFYKKHFDGINGEDIQSYEDFQKLPFTEKKDLQDSYPMGISAVDNKDIVRIHSSSGTSGTPVIIPYTKKDLEDWAKMFKRCYEVAGVTNEDIIHITPGYGLWTAGIGFQLGAELLGAMTIPLGPGNTSKQLKMMKDLKSTVLTATSSYALLLGEEIEKYSIKKDIHLKKALIGSERWGKKMRERISKELGVELYDIYGLTEIYGPGIGISCKYESGMHIWDDYIFYEIIDPKTNERVKRGEVGELVVTTLEKEGAPLIRYRTHDLTREIEDDCPCGLAYPRIDTLIGRSDDMIKIKGTILYPSSVDQILSEVEGASSEYQIIIDHLNGRDILTLFFETELEDEEVIKKLEREIVNRFKDRIGFTPKVISVGFKDLPRNEKKSTRIFDNRY